MQVRYIRRETAFWFAEELALNVETYVISANEFMATCNWQVIGVQDEQNRCKDRALRRAVTLGFPRTGVIAHVHPEIRSRSSRPTSRVNQYGMLLLSL